MIDRHRNSIIEAGLRSADAMMMDEDKIWSRYSDDKIDIGERLAKVIRTLSVANPLNKQLRALSIGSSTEPQFRILETAFRGGLYLFDIDPAAMAIVRDRAIRQRTAHVRAVIGDYRKVFSNPVEVDRFFADTLERRKLDLIARNDKILLDTSRVQFFVDDFGKFMKVVWMIMLYPGVHHYDTRQREEIVEFVYDKFWSARQPLLQMQHHLVVYRGIGFRGLI